MADASESMINKWLERIEAKIDRFHERSVTRDEFERYKTSAQKEHDDIRYKLEKLRDSNAEKEKELQNRKEDEASKNRLFWSGLILTPIVSIAVNYFVLRGGV